MSYFKPLDPRGEYGVKLSFWGFIVLVKFLFLYIVQIRSHENPPNRAKTDLEF